MSSSSEDNDSGAEEETINGDTDDNVISPARTSSLQPSTPARTGRIAELLQEELEEVTTPPPLGNGKNVFKSIGHVENGSDDGSSSAILHRPGSPSESMLSVPDDTPSVQGSVLSSPGGSSILPSVASRPGLESPTPSFRPFDRRFQSRLSSYGLNSPRPSSPAFLQVHSRNVSISSARLSDPGDTDTPSPPWEVVRWTKLKKLNAQAFSEVGKRNFGAPTCIAVSASIVLGTSKGIILIFDYHQNLKSIIGPGTKAVESGPITAVAISADHLIVAGGHANGSIFTWETAKAARPFLHIPGLSPAQMVNRTLDGHAPDVAIRHLGFLGTRHTALVSADDKGMAFSHLATRGMGVVSRSVKTTRILGRYPEKPSIESKARKPSTVLGFSPLPLGNVERGTDTLGLTAILTPYLLVIVSTTPIAQTQHKAARPKEVAAHSAMSGCLAWFPAVKLKVPDPRTGSDVSRVKLVYCWSNVLTVLDVEEIPAPDKDKPPSLTFRARSRWKAEEAIVAVQWLSRSVLTILTITQRLIILEDGSMRMTEAFDLVSKHIYHKDLFSEQLHSLVEQLDEEDTSMHGVVADAFYMSFKAYKSRMFLLGFGDVSIGTLSNWADRLIALMEDGDYIGAIQLATSYFTGDADKLTIGLPEDTVLRHSMVRDKLVEIMSASLKYAFNKKRSRDQQDDPVALTDLVETCFVACLSISDTDFLFEEAYEWYEDGEVEGLFLEALEPRILDQQITAIPPRVVKALVNHFVSHEWQTRLEEMLCQMETMTLDIDQVTTLCKQHSLYDALIYVYNQALRDYITPLIELLTLLKPLVQNGDYFADHSIMEDPVFGVNALKMFPYLSYVFTGRVYPTGDTLEEQDALNAKAEAYWYLFSGRSISWPKGSRKPFLTQSNRQQEPAFPYLRMILKFDAPSFLSVLNEAFEDSFLNDAADAAVNGRRAKDLPEEQVFGLTINRQYVVTILLEVLNSNDFAAEDTIYLDMFIARNLPKYSQYLLLSGSALHKVLDGLCHYPGDDLAADAQLSVEYLLSVYHPPDLDSLLPLFRKAGFFRVLKSIYRSERHYDKLVQAYFDDPDDQDSVFDCVADCLRPRSGLTKRQIQDVYAVIKAHTHELLQLDPTRSARTIEALAPELHQVFLDSLPGDTEIEFTYLGTILEPDSTLTGGGQSQTSLQFTERYVQLMCKFKPLHVSEYIESAQATSIQLDKVLPYMEESGVIDAAVVLMARDGQVQEGMRRLIQHLRKLESALSGILNSSKEDVASIHAREATDDLVEALQKYAGVGVWLCQYQTTSQDARSLAPPAKKSQLSKTELLPSETLWLDIVDAIVQITQSLSTKLTTSEISDEIDHSHIYDQLRLIVQRSFTALLTSTSTPNTSSIGVNVSFLRILRAFLTRASITSPNLSDLRAVLGSIFSAYAYEESILRLSNQLLEKDLFVNVRTATQLRQRGWRPRGSTCEGCRRRVWGPGVPGDIYSKWEEKQESDQKNRLERKAMTLGGQGADGKGKGHARNTSKASIVEPIRKNSDETEESSVDETQLDSAAVENGTQQEMGPLIVLACRHIYHQSCLEAVQVEGHDGLQDFRCPIDG